MIAKTTRNRTIVALLIAAVLAAGYLIAVKEGPAAKETTGETGFAAFH